MHQGQIPGPPNVPVNQTAPVSNMQQTIIPTQASAPLPNIRPVESKETSSDDVISGAPLKHTEEVAVAANPPDDAPKAADKPSDRPAEEPAEEKKEKKEKSKASHLVYSDQNTSPEEKMARMPRYAFTPEKAR